MPTSRHYNEDDAIRLFIQLGTGLAILHSSCGCAHLGVCPVHCGITPLGTIRLTNLGFESLFPLENFFIASSGRIDGLERRLEVIHSSVSGKCTSPRPLNWLSDSVAAVRGGSMGQNFSPPRGTSSYLRVALEELQTRAHMVAAHSKLFVEPVFRGDNALASRALFTAPEVYLSDSTYDPYLADAWSLGAVFHAMLTGYPPFQGKDLRQFLSRACRLKFSHPELLAKLQPRTVRVLCDLLDPNPQTRLPVHRLPQAALWLAAAPVALGPWLTDSQLNSPDQFYIITSSSSSSDGFIFGSFCANAPLTSASQLLPEEGPWADTEPLAVTWHPGQGLMLLSVQRLLAASVRLLGLLSFTSDMDSSCDTGSCRLAPNDLTELAPALSRLEASLTIDEQSSARRMSEPNILADHRQPRRNTLSSIYAAQERPGGRVHAAPPCVRSVSASPLPNSVTDTDFESEISPHPLSIVYTVPPPAGFYQEEYEVTLEQLIHLRALAADFLAALESQREMMSSTADLIDSIDEVVAQCRSLGLNSIDIGGLNQLSAQAGHSFDYPSSHAFAIDSGQIPPAPVQLLPLLKAALDHPTEELVAIPSSSSPASSATTIGSLIEII